MIDRVLSVAIVGFCFLVPVGICRAIFGGWPWDLDD